MWGAGSGVGSVSVGEPKKEVGEKGLADATIKYGVNSPGGFPGQLWLLGFA